MQYFGQRQVEKEAAYLLASGNQAVMPSELPLVDFASPVTGAAGLPGPVMPRRMYTNGLGEECQAMEKLPSLNAIKEGTSGVSLPVVDGFGLSKLALMTDEEPRIKRHSEDKSDYIYEDLNRLLLATLKASADMYFTQEEADHSSLENINAEAEESHGRQYSTTEEAKTADRSSLENIYAEAAEFHVRQFLQTTYEEAARRWLARLFHQEVTPCQMLQCIREGGSLHLKICKRLLVELDNWLSHATSTAPINDPLQGQIIISMDFLQKLLNAKVLDSSGVAVALQCLQKIKSHDVRQLVSHKKGSMPGHRCAAQRSNVRSRYS
jgi:hypothetical protein